MIVSIIWISIIIAIIVSDIIFEIVLKKTYSNVTQDWVTNKFPASAFAIFYLASHLVLPKLFYIPGWLGILILLINVIAIQIIRAIIKIKFNKIAITLLAFMGLVQGWLFWAQ